MRPSSLNNWVNFITISTLIGLISFGIDTISTKYLMPPLKWDHSGGKIF
jgi:hypothetical protein